MTAQETLDYYNEQSTIKTAMIEFARFHVQEALKAATNCTYEHTILGVRVELHPKHKQSILNAYPLDNIK